MIIIHIERISPIHLVMEFKVHHYAVIELLNDESYLERQQDILDKHMTMFPLKFTQNFVCNIYECRGTFYIYLWTYEV